jgi:hypothetical protein
VHPDCCSSPSRRKLNSVTDITRKEFIDRELHPGLIVKPSSTQGSVSPKDRAETSALLRVVAPHHGSSLEQGRNTALSRVPSDDRRSRDR